MTKNNVLTALASAVALAGLWVVLTSGTKVPVCQHASAWAVIPYSSLSDLETARQLAPSVTKQAAVKAATACSPVISAISNARVESDLQLRVQPLVPPIANAPNPKPHRDKLIRQAEAHYKKTLIDPLARIDATPTSPYFSTLGKLGDELTVQGLKHVSVVMIGDGIAVEKSPVTGRRVDLRSLRPDRAALQEFLPLLRKLSGRVDCVYLVGAGAASTLDPRKLRQARRLMGAALGEVGVPFAATRSDKIPDRCEVAQ